MGDDSAEARDKNWRELMRAAQDGDGAAYSRLLCEILPLLRRMVARKWRAAQDVDDIVQDILLSVHAVRHTYDPARAFMPWLMTIAARRIADAARRSSARSAHEATVETMPETFDADETKSEQDRSDDHGTIVHAMSGLPHGQRQAVEFLKLKGLSLEEASAATGKSVASLRVTMHRALKAMRKALEEKR